MVASLSVAGCTEYFHGPSSSTSPTTLQGVASASVQATAQPTTTPAETPQATSTPSPAKIATSIHVWAGYMGMPAFWLDDPQHNPVAQGSQQQVRYWIDGADDKHPCAASNYYIDNAAAGGEWKITSPQPQYWAGCPGGLAGGAGGLYLYPADTAKLSLGLHTLKIDYLGDNTYAPSQFVAQFLVVAGTPSPSPTSTPTLSATLTPTANTPSNGPFVGSINSDVYHYPSCYHVKTILPENLVSFPTATAAQAAGYRPCKDCNPPT